MIVRLTLSACRKGACSRRWLWEGLAVLSLLDDRNKKPAEEHSAVLESNFSSKFALGCDERRRRLAKLASEKASLRVAETKIDLVRPSIW